MVVDCSGTAGLWDCWSWRELRGGLGFAVGLGRGLTAPFSGVSVSYAIMVAVRWTRQVRGREDTVAWRRERPDAWLEPDLGGVGSRLGCGLFPGPEAADLGFI